MDRTTRRIGGGFAGQRDALGAFGLWESLPTPYLDATAHTDGLSLSRGVMFRALHRIAGTQRMEWFNATLRLRLAHLVRKSLSFSRKQANLETLLWLFILRFNASFP